MQLPLPEQPEDLPNWGQSIVYAGIAVGSALAVFVARLGLLAGRRSGGQDVEIAGAVIDRAKAEQLIEAFDRNTEAVEKAAGAVGELRQEVRELTREFIRTGTRGRSG